MRFFIKPLLFTVVFLFNLPHLYAAKPAGIGDWVLLGATNEPSSPWGLQYFKLLQVNSDAHRYGSIYEVSIQGDANYFERQGTYQIRVDKYEGTTGRFDGLEVRCISGNPAAATFYVFNNALWLRSNYQWGNVYYRPVADYGAIPLNAAPFGQTVTAPVGFVASTGTSGIKCDFDNNQFYLLPSTDVKGNMTVPGSVGIGTSPNYPLHLVSRGNTNKAAAYLWGENYGLAIGTLSKSAAQYALAVLGNANTDGSSATGGANPLLYVRNDGNVGIGTTLPQAKLAVNGDLFAKRVKVTQAGWPDFVFHDTYQLPSLQEVEHFVKNNKHLPTIPSEKEINTNGLDIGEMEKLLLQKVEEQMLYIIELNKKLEASLERTRKLEQQMAGKK
ncbi:hypothetical protein HGH93_12910 [Chitinophaga polysaccharea]|uniref:hypothetical protein n=1 Tax=Chitinophaga polysaccharea TaxID=1293035 RepID=UPI0014557A25|nr:hypothetical protein [Chitinophaga polysaccharea]NLR59008.1 hypothetical protein [Chitinophaga polysaccharea]